MGDSAERDSLSVNLVATAGFILLVAPGLLLAVGSFWVTITTLRADLPVPATVALLALLLVSMVLVTLALGLTPLGDSFEAPIVLGVFILAGMAVAVITASVEVRVEQAEAATVSSAQPAGPLTPAPWSWNG